MLSRSASYTVGVVGSALCSPWTRSRSRSSMLGILVWGGQGGTRPAARKKHAHSSNRPLAIFAAKRQQVGEDVMLGECTPDFDDQQLRPPDGSEGCICFRKVVWGPERMPWPTRRTRQLVFVHNMATMVWTGPEDFEVEFRSLFEKRCAARGSCFAADSLDGIKQDFERWGHKRHQHLKGLSTLEGVDFRNLLPPGARHRLLKYEARSNCRGDDANSDISQHLQFGAAASPDFPCLTRGSVIWCHSINRPYTSKEHLLSLGLPTVPNVSDAYPLLTSEAFHQPHPKGRRSLAGNGQHLAAMMSWGLYCLSNIERGADLERVDFIAEHGLAAACAEDDHVDVDGI